MEELNLHLLHWRKIDPGCWLLLRGIELAHKSEWRDLFYPYEQLFGLWHKSCGVNSTS